MIPSCTTSVRRWCGAGVLLAFTLPALADTASPLYQYQTKATVARYEGGLTQVGRAVAPHPGRAAAAQPQREVTDPVECATDYAWCPTNPAIGCDTSPTWCFQTDPITCQTNIEWCHTNPAWGCIDTDPAHGCAPTDPQWGCIPTDPAWGCPPTDPAWGCIPTDPAWGCVPTDPSWCATDPNWCATDFTWCATDFTWCNTDQSYCATDPTWCATDFNWCATDPNWCATDPTYCSTDPTWCNTDPSWCATDPTWCATDPNWCSTDPMWCTTDPATCPVVGADDQPVGLELGEAQPNPFNPFTTLSFSLPETGQVRLLVYDLRGRMVRELVNGMVSRGTNRVLFDGSNLPSGVYLYVLETEQGTLRNKMLLVK
ncbi:MAG: T9SS type A sorting domain-containing protein [Candidatus Delongbacteria bacterium]